MVRKNLKWATSVANCSTIIGLGLAVISYAEFIVSNLYKVILEKGFSIEDIVFIFLPKFYKNYITIQQDLLYIGLLILHFSLAYIIGVLIISSRKNGKITTIIFKKYREFSKTVYNYIKNR